MTYKEALERASKIPLENKDDVLAQIWICSKHYEEKLKALMGEKAFMEFSTNVAKLMFLDWINALPNSEFRNFAFDNFEEITK